MSAYELDLASTASSFSINGVEGTIPCHAWGDANKACAAIVMVHGLNAHAGWFEAAARQFKLNNIYAVAYDQTGFGQRKSSTCRNYTGWLRDLEVVFHHVQKQMGNRPVFLLGNSMGALISVSVARDLKPAGLILTAPAFAGNPKAFTLGFTVKAFAKALINPSWKILEPYTSQEISRSSEAQNWISQDLEDCFSVPAGVFLQIYFLIKHAAKKVASVNCPVLMLTAKDDWVVDNKASMKVFEKLKGVPKLHREFADAYHDLLLDPLVKEISDEMIEWMQNYNTRSFSNLPEMFFDRASRMDSSIAIQYKEGTSEFESIDWRSFSELCTNIGCGLLSMGLPPKQPVVIFGPNSYKWIACDIGILSAGGVSAPIYTTSSAHDVDHILHNCEAPIAFVHGTAQLSKLLSSSSPKLKKIVILDKGFEQKLDSSCISFDEFIAAGAAYAEKSPQALKQRIDNIKCDDLATIIYTSGTTGTPKGAMLTHGNILSVLSDISTIIPVGMHEVYLSYLPLSHVFERVAGEFYWIHSGGVFAIAESVERFPRDFTEVQPSMLLVVPRILDRMYAKVQNGLKQASFSTRSLVEWSLNVGNQIVEAKSKGKQLSPWLKLQQYWAERIALSKLRQKIGTRLKLVVCGSAPSVPEVMRFFNAIGISTLEGYGLTETAAPVTANRLNQVKIGTVGPPLKSVELRLGHDDEILVRGPSIFAGYYKNESETEKVFESGWFHTGDVGKIDSDGHLIITDRKKDLIINAAGKNIAPQRIEARLNEIPVVSQSIVFGDRQKCLVALFTLDENSTMELAKQQGWQADDFQQLCQSKSLNQYLRQQIADKCKDLAGYEKIRQFAILPHSLSVDEGELTPTLKVKRMVVAERYRELINSLYQGEPIAV